MCRSRRSKGYRDQRCQPTRRVAHLEVAVGDSAAHDLGYLAKPAGKGGQSQRANQTHGTREILPRRIWRHGDRARCR